MTPDEQTISEILSLSDDKAKIAMIQLYKKQKCIAFAQWLSDNDYRPFDKMGKDHWLQGGMSVSIRIGDLYTIFLSTNQ